MSKRYNYFYRITNTVNGKYYYGVHSTDDLNDNYMGSGTVLKDAIKKYGIENFVKDILVYFDSADEMYEYERSIVDMNKVRDRQCYNVALGGYGGDLGEEVRKNISDSLKGKNKGKQGPMKGKHHSDETRKKISESNKGKPRPKSEETRRKLSEANKGKQGPMKGKHHSDETRKKISESLKGKSSGAKGKHHSDETRKKISDANKGKSTGPKGKHWRLAPTTNKRIYY